MQKRKQKYNWNHIFSAARMKKMSLRCRKSFAAKLESDSTVVAEKVCVRVTQDSSESSHTHLFFTRSIERYRFDVFSGGKAPISCR